MCVFQCTIIIWYRMTLILIWCSYAFNVWCMKTKTILLSTLSALIWSALNWALAIAPIITFSQIRANQIRAAEIKAGWIFLADRYISKQLLTLADWNPSKQCKDQINIDNSTTDTLLMNISRDHVIFMFSMSFQSINWILG